MSNKVEKLLIQAFECVEDENFSDALKLYDLARKGITIERKPHPISVDIQLLSYEYPFIKLHITCSRGTYIRTLANDIGAMLKCGAYLYALTRLRCGDFHLDQCVDQNLLLEKDFQICNWLIK